jgi:hypothetical protein
LLSFSYDAAQQKAPKLMILKRFGHMLINTQAQKKTRSGSG